MGIDLKNNIELKQDNAMKFKLNENLFVKNYNDVIVSNFTRISRKLIKK